MQLLCDALVEEWLFPTLVEIMLVYLLRRDEAHTKPSMLYFGRSPLKELSRIILFYFLPYILTLTLLMKMLLHFFLENFRIYGVTIITSNKSQYYKSLIFQVRP